MDKGRGDLCCTTLSTDLWTIDLPRPHYHKILLDRWVRAAFFGIFLALSFFRFDGESQPTHLPLTQAVRRQLQQIASVRNEVKP